MDEFDTIRDVLEVYDITECNFYFRHKYGDDDDYVYGENNDYER